MNIIILSCVAPPETVVSGRINWDIACYLSKNNHNVTIISPIPSRPIGNFSNELAYDKVFENGVRHIRINSYRHPEKGFIGRVLESFSFGLRSVRIINKLDCDILYSMPWPLIGQFFINFLVKDRNIKIIMNVQDLYPESLLLKIKSNFLRKILHPLKWVDHYSAQKSNYITVVSHSLKDFYINMRGIEKNKITVIKNWQDESEFINNKVPDKAKILNLYNLEDLKGKFIFMYLGNIGPVAGIDKLIKSFSKYNSTNVAMIIAGSGTAKQQCFDLKEKMNLSNVYFQSVSPGLKSVVEIQSIADCMLLPIQGGADSSSIPSKLIAYMFSKKSIISSASNSSFTGKAIIDSQCGWLIKNNSDFNNIIDKVINTSKIELDQMGKRGFDFAIKNYSKQNGLKMIEKLFKRIINGK